MNNPEKIEVFDREDRRKKLKRCRAKLAEHNFLFEWAEKQLSERILDVTKTFPTAIQIGTRNSGDPFSESNKIENLFKIDIEDAQTIADEEFLPLKPGSIDLITSTLNLHSVNDLPGCLLQIKQALKPDGLFLAAMLGGETLYELRESLTQAELKLKNGISPRIFPFADKQQMGALLQRAGFALPVVDSEIVTVTYDNMFKLMNDIRGMGEGNIIQERSRTNPGKALFMEAAQYYAEHFSEPDGKIRASFEVIFLIGWSPHESQQKPLAPGSAETRLADALNTDELQAGEKAAP